MHSDEEDEEEDSEMKTALFQENEELPVSATNIQLCFSQVWGREEA